jgi:predicted nucleotidyltransferase
VLWSVRSANHERSPATSLPDDFPRRELILELARRLVEHPAVERIWLFGSRARGDNFERSDIDLAVEAPGINRPEWAALHLDFDEEADRLLLIDFVLMDDMPESFRRRVHREGGCCMNEETLRESLASLGDALDRFGEALAIPNPDEIVMDGTIQRFEFTFELFWKTLRRFLQREGIDTASPKNPLRHAYRGAF